MNSLINLLNTPVADAVKFQLEVNFSRGTGFADGEIGRQNNLIPKADQWFSADYRQGFIAPNSSNMAIAKHDNICCLRSRRSSLGLNAIAQTLI